MVPLDRPVAKGVKERLKVGSIEGEEEEKGEELDIPLWVPPFMAVLVMSEMRVTLGVGEEALIGEAVGNFKGVSVPPPPPSPPSEVLVAHKVMEGEEDWEGSSALCVLSVEIVKEGEGEEDTVNIAVCAEDAVPCAPVPVATPVPVPPPLLEESWVGKGVVEAVVVGGEE